MKRMLAALMLVIVTAAVGCVDSAHVDKGGGETAVLVQENGRITGRIDVGGHVVNSGGKKAKDVVLYFKFFQDGAVFLEDRLLAGDISAGTSKSFNGSFFGRPVTGVFTWEYRIEWD
jgi:hypothetical protein